MVEGGIYFEKEIFGFNRIIIIVGITNVVIGIDLILSIDVPISREYVNNVLSKKVNDNYYSYYSWKEEDFALIENSINGYLGKIDDEIRNQIFSELFQEFGYINTI